MTVIAEYVQGSDLPDLTFEWRDRNGTLLAFATGWTFVLKIGAPGSTAAVSKSTSITGADAAPNVTVAWATTAELNTLTSGSYEGQLIATRTSDSKQRILPFGLVVRKAIA